LFFVLSTSLFTYFNKYLYFLNTRLELGSSGVQRVGANGATAPGTQGRGVSKEWKCKN